MLRNTLFPSLRCSKRYLSRSLPASNKDNNTFPKPNKGANNGNIDDASKMYSVQESTMFTEIFEAIEKKFKKAEANEPEMIDKFSKMGVDIKDNEGKPNTAKSLQVLFGANRSISKKDSRLLSFFRDTAGENRELNESPTLTNDDIRKYPVSLLSSSLNVSETKKDLNSTISGLGKLEVPTAENIGYSMNLTIKEQTLKNLENKQKLRIALDDALSPHIEIMKQLIRTDYDALEYVKNKIISFPSKRENYHMNKDIGLSETIEEIKENCSIRPNELPSPGEITLPHVIVTLLASPDFVFSMDRKYNLISYIYNECKKSTNMELYLSVCNVDFYNILLQLSWDNFKEINLLKQIITEMSINGIIGDIQTIEVLDNIVDDLRYLNDHMLDYELKDPTIQKDKLSVNLLWCRENSMSFSTVENYLQKLKESLT
ncbi:hypothetical protein Kpol_1032p22 [Vanderwaltozyma polyspora DSM 70294]|uniref:Mtf2-like C-terminal domain-containing protein n=1 Tax=Vanderwaltozyma polyspora (strain ATCC 22028 / DSM 70294 / BCRC 21397 / CBS 2163 / NBRC 10782 / NRRL Y-8283 / UCD 57-17) TaxID=436907 RepID=A7TGX7_VANPO|nr:uncharacterized protein Kpol_1032p22 [Vanderwaltozyma polyspora DSM 70294]EDO18429.1 hypothetical protein Kpol_1032p22 [Vanderwaltozyma polyspora DSM 70294]